MLLSGVGALVLLFGMSTPVRDFHLPLLIASQGFCAYVTYYFMLSVLLFSVHTPMLIFGMSVLMLPHCRYFCILFFVISAPLWSRRVGAHRWYKHTDAHCWYKRPEAHYQCKHTNASY